MALTDTAVRNAKPKAKPYKVTDSQGLYLLVNPKGSKLWRSPAFRAFLDLPGAVIDLAMRLGAQGGPSGSPNGPIVSLSQTDRMLRAIDKDDWMSFTARQTIETGACNFAWRAMCAVRAGLCLRCP